MSKSVLLIISGSIAAYKSLDLIRRLRERGWQVRCIMTHGAEQFITPLAVASLSGSQVYNELFSLKDEVEMGHIRLTREADVIVVAPATADLLAKIAHGFAGDLASATLLASNKPVLVAPAMNTQMWNHPATSRNLAQLKEDGVHVIEPSTGILACGETGSGRMADIDAIVNAVVGVLTLRQGPLAHLKALVTSGPTYEAIDPVRFIGNRSSGKQGHAIAGALAEQGAEVTLVSGPTALADPPGVSTHHVNTADQMLRACEAALPVDIAVCAAAVADWRVSQPSARKLKKTSAGDVPELHLIENPDILAFLAGHAVQRPKLVIGFAAETENVKENAIKKLKSKGCDWIVANDVSGDKAFDARENEVMLITDKNIENWPLLSKEAIAYELTQRIVNWIIK